MGTPTSFFTPSIVWRVDSLYKWNMGGSSINGRSSGNILKITTDSLRAKPFDSVASFSVIGKSTDSLRLTSTITVNATAIKSIPKGMKLHAAIVESTVDYEKLYGSATVNGQTKIYNVVRELLTDSLGVEMGSLAAGETFSITKSFTRDPNFQNADSLKVVTWIQIDSSKEIISSYESDPVAMPENTAIVHFRAVRNVLPLSVTISNDKQLTLTAPFENATISIQTFAGRVVRSMVVQGKGGAVTIDATSLSGTYICSVRSNSGEFFVQKVLLK